MTVQQLQYDTLDSTTCAPESGTSSLRSPNESSGPAKKISGRGERGATLARLIRVAVGGQ